MDKLDLGKIFSIAIKREIEAHEFYKDVVNKVDNDAVKDVFQKLADEEMGHMELLEKMKHDSTSWGSFGAPSKDFHIAEATDLPELTTTMKPKDAVALAMKKEQQAMEFYQGLADAADANDTKDTFAKLAEMERSHKVWLEDVFIEIGYPEVF